jgi:hypothetical protein
LPLIAAGAAGVPIRDVCDAICIAIEDWLGSPSQLQKIAIVTGGTDIPELTHSLQAVLRGIETPECCAERLQGQISGQYARRWADAAAIPPFSRAFALAQLMAELLTQYTSLTEARLASDHFRRRVREALGDFPSELRARIVNAVYVRNRLMHETSGSATLDDLIALNRAIYDLICCFQQDSDRRQGHSLDAIPSHTPLPQESTTPALAVADASSATAPVRKLQRLLQERLKPEVLLRLGSRLKQKGMLGSPDMTLLEGLLTTSPLDFLAGELSRHELEPVAAGIVSDCSRHEARALARILLQKLGFPMPDAVKGLSSVMTSVKSARSRLAVPQLCDVDGAVSSCAKHLEYVCHVLIRFLCFAAFKQAPEPFFQARGNLPPGRLVGKCTLGTLLTLTEVLAKAISEDRDSLSVSLFKACFNNEDPFPKGLTKLANVRNSFAHFQADMVQQSTEQRVNKALGFLDASLDFFAYLSRTDPRIFPTIVRIDQIVIDRWGRELIQVITDEGISEVVFTDQQLNPGRVYFMHPLTNPLRVDPILVAAGDLTWPADAP